MIPRVRDDLTRLTKRPQMRCAAVHVYTDDMMGQVIGFERFVRLIKCWYQVESVLNIRRGSAKSGNVGSYFETAGLLSTVRPCAVKFDMEPDS